jgi:hypothetical protein
MRTFIAIALCLAILPSNAYAKRSPSPVFDKLMLDAVGAVEFENRAAAMCPDYKATIDFKATLSFIDSMENVIGHKQVSARLKKIDSLVSEINLTSGRDTFCIFAKHVQEKSAD